MLRVKVPFPAHTNPGPVGFGESMQGGGPRRFEMGEIVEVSERHGNAGGEVVYFRDAKGTQYLASAQTFDASVGEQEW